MIFEAGFHLFIQLNIGEEEEFGFGRTLAHKHQIVGYESGIGAGFARPRRCIDDGSGGALFPIGWEIFSEVSVVGMGHSSVVGGRCQSGVGLIGHDDGRMFSTDVEHRTGGTALGVEPVEFQAGEGRNARMSGACSENIRGEFVGHRDFLFGIFREGNTDGVADAVGQQCSDAHSAFDAAVLAFAGFRDTEVEGEVHPLTLHGFDQQTHALHHDHGVGGLDGDGDVEELLLHADTQKFHTTFHDAGRCVAVVAHNAIGKAAVIDADAQSGAVGFADVDEFFEARFEAF